MNKTIGLVDLGKHTGLSPALLSKIERAGAQEAAYRWRVFAASMATRSAVTP